MRTESLDDPVLGALADTGGRYHTTRELAGHSVSVVIDPDGESTEATMKFARVIVRALKKICRLAKQAASERLLETYNTGWREFDEAGEDGEIVTRSRRVLTATGFERRLVLSDVTVLGPAHCSLYFADGDLFWGHTVVVTTFDAAATWGHVELSG